MVQHGKPSFFVDGMYSYDDLNDYLQTAVAQNDDDKNGINLIFVLSRYRVIIEFKKNWQDNDNTNEQLNTNGSSAKFIDSKTKA